MKAFLALRPELVVSVVRTGELPKTLPAWVGTVSLKLHHSEQNAWLDSCQDEKQTFILELELPEAENYPGLQRVEDSSQIYHRCNKINIGWIKKAFVFSEPGSKIFCRLLNSQIAFPVQLREPTLFLVKEPSHGNATLDHDCAAASSASALESDSQAKRATGGAQSASKRVHIWFNPIEAPPSSQGARYIQQGDLLTSGMKALVNTVNCVGVMGKGIALAFKQQYPEMFKDYVKRCTKKELKPGQPYCYEERGRIIINFPTKDHWRKPSQMAWIKQGLEWMVTNIPKMQITSLAIPPLGCGNGGLEWSEVYPLIRQYLDPLQIPIEIYSPFPEPTKALGKHR